MWPWDRWKAADQAQPTSNSEELFELAEEESPQVKYINKRQRDWLLSRLSSDEVDALERLERAAFMDTLKCGAPWGAGFFMCAKLMDRAFLRRTRQSIFVNFFNAAVSLYITWWAGQTRSELSRRLYERTGALYVQQYTTEIGPLPAD